MRSNIANVIVNVVIPKDMQLFIGGSIMEGIFSNIDVRSAILSAANKQCGMTQGYIFANLSAVSIVREIFEEQSKGSGDFGNNLALLDAIEVLWRQISWNLTNEGDQELHPAEVSEKEYNRILAEKVSAESRKGN